LQFVVALVADGTLGMAVSVEEDLWEETAELDAEDLQDHRPCIQVRTDAYCWKRRYRRA
jgi:hypothetical protein